MRKNLLICGLILGIATNISQSNLVYAEDI